MNATTVNNSAVRLKLAVREQCKAWALAADPSGYRVLDAFAGAGMMRASVYTDAADYLGIEKDPTHARPGVWIGDNLKLIPQAFHRRSWNLIDLDAHTNPYEAFMQVGRYAPAGDYAITLTCCLRRLLMQSNVSKWVRWVTKYPHADGRYLIRWYDDVTRWSWQAVPRLVVHEAKRAVKDPATKSVVYYALRCSFVGAPTGQHAVSPPLLPG